MMNQTIHVEEDTELDDGIESQGFPAFRSVRLARSPRCREIGTDKYMVGKVTRSVGVSLPTSNFSVKTCLKLIIELWLSNRSYSNGYIRLVLSKHMFKKKKLFKKSQNVAECRYGCFFLLFSSPRFSTQYPTRPHFVCVIFYSDWKITIWLNSLLFFRLTLEKLLLSITKHHMF